MPMCKDSEGKKLVDVFFYMKEGKSTMMRCIIGNKPSVSEIASWLEIFGCWYRHDPDET
jgi:hypothetical protein